MLKPAPRVEIDTGKVVAEPVIEKVQTNKVRFRKIRKIIIKF